MKLALLVLFLVSCARAPLEDPRLAFRLSGAPESMQDSFDFSSLREQLKLSLDASEGKFPNEYVLGERTISRADYAIALRALLAAKDFPEFEKMVKEHFEFYEIYGNENGWGKVLSTGYYEPVIRGSKVPTKEFSVPLYAAPPDLVVVNAAEFLKRNPAFDSLPEVQRARFAFWRARYIAKDKKVVPYFTRQEIQAGAALAGKKLELAWLDPLDAFFLEVQGSGTIEFSEREKIRVGYDGQNGQPYVAIGKFLLDKIPLEKMSMQRIREELKKLDPASRDQILFQNPSLVFFKKLQGPAMTYCGVGAVGQRTIATDNLLIPKGLLHFFAIETPVFADAASLDPSAWEKKDRWVVDLDTGGAIRGGGRVDLFMGKGPEVEREAGAMKREGRLWAIAPRQEFLDSLKAAGFSFGSQPHPQ